MFEMEGKTERKGGNKDERQMNGRAHERTSTRTSESPNAPMKARTPLQTNGFTHN